MPGWARVTSCAVASPRCQSSGMGGVGSGVQVVCTGFRANIRADVGPRAWLRIGHDDRDSVSVAERPAVSATVSFESRNSPRPHSRESRQRHRGLDVVAGVHHLQHTGADTGAAWPERDQGRAG